MARPSFYVLMGFRSLVAMLDANTHLATSPDTARISSIPSPSSLRPAAYKRDLFYSFKTLKSANPSYLIWRTSARLDVRSDIVR